VAATLRVLAISGSLRRDSYNTRLLRAAAAELPPGAGLERFGGLEAVPPYNEDEDADFAPDAALRLRRAIDAADALLIATPEYNGSVPGQLKNAIDWASRPFPDNALRGKPVAVIGASTGRFGAVWAQAELRKVLGAAGARVLDRDLPLARAAEAFDPDGRLLDESVAPKLRSILSELAHEVRPLARAA
jgi:chromate reductase